MLKPALISLVAKRHKSMRISDVEIACNVIFDRLSEALAHGERIELRGLFALYTVERESRTGRNPQNGAPVAVKAKRIIRAKCGKILNKRLNPRDEPRGPHGPDEAQPKLR